MNTETDNADKFSVMKTFGPNLKSLMQRDRLSVVDVAAAIGEPKKSVAEWIGPRARTPRNLDVIPKLASLFKCSIAHLLTGAEDSNGGIESFLERTQIHTGLYEITLKKVTEKK